MTTPKRAAFRRWFRDCRIEAQLTTTPVARTFDGIVFRAHYTGLKPNGLRPANLTAAETRAFAVGCLDVAAKMRQGPSTPLCSKAVWHLLALEGSRDANKRAKAAGFRLP